jgi:hypothetical protein
MAANNIAKAANAPSIVLEKRWPRPIYAPQKTWISGLSSEPERELPAVLQTVLRAMMNEQQLRGGLEGNTSNAVQRKWVRGQFRPNRIT